ncbi:hypothetical protein [Pararhizobium antarcticum]|uniref:DUF1176 domain-containing protein n=1 Tax=Pararhizobium antarcticum TaxID=1798805 RepID=A0A657LQX1_9HYPH|nr:hypothetical protein [Pararhizobium antarcticum]OJF94976.1 hypothetical protein AX760_03860 [Pararhizobium antarcticum]OJF97478.1 hypothetical protein AX761_14760 [Rhizobium sp. 58]
MKRKSIPILVSIGLLMSGKLPGRAQDANSYIDDRSDGAAIVRSLYNAIARQEYARAYGYFGDRKPVGDYKSFVDGYRNTVDVKVLTGTVTPEGAAGSTYEPVPVAVRSVDKDGKQQVFAGCYLTRMASASGQEPPFAPLHIESAELEEVTGPLESAVPKVCHIPS